MKKIDKLDLAQKIAYVVTNIELTSDVPLNNLLQRIEDKINELIERLDKNVRLQ